MTIDDFNKAVQIVKSYQGKIDAIVKEYNQVMAVEFGEAFVKSCNLDLNPLFCDSEDNTKANGFEFSYESKLGFFYNKFIDGVNFCSVVDRPKEEVR